MNAAADTLWNAEIGAAPPPEETADERVARWEREEITVRERAAKAAGVARPDQVLGKPGIALFDALFAGEVGLVPIGLAMDFILMHATPGRAVFQGRPGARFYNPMGTVHGGWYATLLDSALGCCVHAALPAGTAYTTLELKVNLLRALTDRVPLVRAEGRLVHRGARTATAEARLVGADGTLYAHGSTTCLLYPAPMPDDATAATPALGARIDDAPLRSAP